MNDQEMNQAIQAAAKQQADRTINAIVSVFFGAMLAWALFKADIDFSNLLVWALVASIACLLVSVVIDVFRVEQKHESAADIYERYEQRFAEIGLHGEEAIHTDPRGEALIQEYRQEVERLQRKNDQQLQ